MLQDQDGYTLDDFLNKHAEENKPYVKPLTNLRFKGYIFRRIYEDNKDEWNAAYTPERQALLKEIIRTVPFLYVNIFLIYKYCIIKFITRFIDISNISYN